MGITAYQIAKLLGRNPSMLYKVKVGKRRVGPELAAEIDALGIDGWRFADLRPDLVEIVNRAVNHD
jgi:hypothetical protein